MKAETASSLRVAQRPPDPFAGAGMDQQAVRIVQLGPEVVDEAAVVLAA